MRIDIAFFHDIADIRAAYEHGRATQREQGSNVWPEFSDATILGEIEAGRLLRVSENETVAGVFTVAYEDSAIRAPHERGAHIYLHRIARAAAYTGRGLMDAILGWADQQCMLLGREGLRIDTWASNTALIAFYQKRGFHVLDERRLGPDPRLQPHYHNNAFTLHERPHDQ